MASRTKERPGIDVPREIRERRHQDYQWAMTNEELWVEYAGSYVAIRDRQVVAAGEDLATVEEQASRDGWKREELLFMAIPRDAETAPSAGT